VRYVERKNVAEPPALRGPKSPAKKELLDARKHFAGPNRKKAFEFDAFKHEDVKNALQKLFHGKCAYCESVYAATAPVDIEHFRPKGRIKEHPPHPGYWWLAMKWSNLLASCIDCNRQRKQVEITSGMTAQDVTALADTRSRALSGKADSFMTENRKWVMAEGAVKSEKPLLLNPTVDHPDKHLSWAFENGVPVLCARKGDVRGQTSISVFGLNRQRLVEARMTTLNQMRNARTKILKLTIGAKETTDPNAASLMTESAKELASELRAMCAPAAPYSAMATEFVAQLEEELQSLEASV